MDKKPEDKVAAESESGRRPSWPYPIFLILYGVIFLMTPMVGSTVGLVLFFGLIGVGVWNAISRHQYEQLKKNYPAVSRGDYVLNNLVLPVLVPLVLFVVLVMFKMSAEGR